MAKYSNLKKYLETFEGDSIRLSFGQLSEILGFTLPASAAKFRNWWSNSSNGHSEGWLSAGWKVDTKTVVINDVDGQDVAFEKCAITFVRNSKVRKTRKPKTEDVASVAPLEAINLENLAQFSEIPKLVRRFHELLSDGIISQEEFNRAKARILANI